MAEDDDAFKDVPYDTWGSYNDVIDGMLNHVGKMSNNFSDIIDPVLVAIRSGDSEAVQKEISGLDKKIRQPITRMCGVIKAGAKYIWGKIKDGAKNLGSMIKAALRKVDEAIYEVVEDLKIATGISKQTEHEIGNKDNRVFNINSTGRDMTVKEIEKEFMSDLGPLEAPGVEELKKQPQMSKARKILLELGYKLTGKGDKPTRISGKKRSSRDTGRGR